MQKIDKDDIIHWSTVNRNFKAYYVYDEKIYELKVTLPLTINNNTDAIQWIIKCHSKGYTNPITLYELLNNEDKIMTSTTLFKSRISSIIKEDRDKKINKIIYGN